MRLVVDTALREAFRAGEARAFAEVYREYAPRLSALLAHGFCFRSSGRICHFGGYRDRFEMQDTLQEVFARAFSAGARQGYDGLHPFGSYLFAIARNLVLDKLRRPSAAAHVLADAGRLGELVSESLDSHAVLEQGELQAQFAGFLASLDRDRRRVFELRFVEDRSIRATADALLLSEHRIKCAERDLRKQLERWFHRPRCGASA